MYIKNSIRNIENKQQGCIKLTAGTALPEGGMGPRFSIKLDQQYIKELVDFDSVTVY